MSVEFTVAQRRFIILLACWLVASTLGILVLNWADAVARARVLMGSGLIVGWVFAVGTLMHRNRERMSAFVRMLPGSWQVKFVTGCTVLALLEEAIAVGMTNLAPLFGVSTGAAHITASTSWVDTVAFHSVVMFMPLFIGWAYALGRWRFGSFAVALLFGIAGVFAEAFYDPAKCIQHLAEAGLWVPVYGLMVYLPATAVPDDRPAQNPRWYHYLVAPFFVSAVAAPFQIGFGFVISILLQHPRLHF